MKRRANIAGIILVAVSAPVAAYAIALNLPTTIALGPCLKDWTSPSSYRPRASALATADITVATETVRVCYGRPAARGRTVFGNLVPYGRLWRAGANEPTRLFTPVPLIAGNIRLEPGRYSVYVRPGETTWDVYFSTSTFHWGNDLGPAVREREVGMTPAAVEAAGTYVETFTIRGEAGSTDARLVFEWEQTRVVLPLRLAAPGQS